jgi:hypothetical protein
MIAGLDAARASTLVWRPRMSGPPRFWGFAVMVGIRWHFAVMLGILLLWGIVW